MSSWRPTLGLATERCTADSDFNFDMEALNIWMVRKGVGHLATSYASQFSLVKKCKTSMHCKEVGMSILKRFLYLACYIRSVYFGADFYCF